MNHGAVHAAFEAFLTTAPDDAMLYKAALTQAYSARVQEDYTTADTSPEKAAELVALATAFVAFRAHRLGAGPPPTARP